MEVVREDEEGSNGDSLISSKKTKYQFRIAVASLHPTREIHCHPESRFLGMRDLSGLNLVI